MADEIPFESFTGAPARGAPAAKSTTMSMDDFTSEKPKGTDLVSKGIGMLKGIGGESAALADMVLSLPGMAVAVGANLGMQAQAVGRGESHKISAMAGREASDTANAALSNPLQRALALLKSDEIYNEAKTTQGLQKVSGWIQEAGDWVEKNSKGYIPAEQVQTMFDVILLGAGTRGIDTAAKLRKAGADLPKRTEPKEITPAEMTERGPTHTAQQQINEMLNIKGEKEQKAWNDKRKGDVREAFKKDPDYASYLSSLAEERVRNHDNWTAKEGARESSEKMAEQAAMQIQLAADLIAPEGRKGRAEFKSRRVSDELGSKEVSMGEAMRILQKPAEERTGQELLDVRRWNRQAGAVKPEHQAMLAAAGIGTMGGLWLDPEHRLESGLLGAMTMAAPVLLMTGPGRVGRSMEAGAVKGPGGMWHPEAVSRLARPLQDAFGRDVRGMGDIPTVDRVNSQQQWSDKAIRNYLNKYAGTERDPLKDVEVPSNQPGVDAKWGDLMDSIVVKTPIERYAAFKANAKPGEMVHDVGSGNAIQSFLSHVGDYLRQNVKPEDLPRYDLVRAVKETAENDKRVAKQMEKAAAASMKDMPVYKEYKDGFKWVELKLPEKLTEEQGKQVRPATRSELAFQDHQDQAMGEMPATGKREGYVALDAEGKPVKNSYTQDIAIAPTPEEAWLAGRLAEEGNTMGHCVGGYCEGVASGESRIYSLRDSKGKSHVTVEVAPANPVPKDPRGERATTTDDITQIKGKQNRAPSKEYLPYVQDFVKSGKWGEVGDASNAMMIRGDSASAKGLGLDPHSYYTTDEVAKAWTAKEMPPRLPGKSQEGAADLKTVARVGATAAGAIAGASLLDDKTTGAIIGGLGALAMTAVSPRAVAGVVKKAFAPDERIRVNTLANTHEYRVAAAARAIWQVQISVEKSVPKVERRNAITHFLEGDDSIKLSATEAHVAQVARNYFDEMAKAGQENGVLKDAVNNYVTHLWEHGGQTKGKIMEVFEKRGGQNMSPETRFAMRRQVPTIAEGKALGLKPQSEDISTILGVYGNAIQRAMANKQLLASLKGEKSPEGQALVQPSAKAPSGYVPVDHPQMAGLRVHPDIAPSLGFIFDNYRPGVILRGLEGINTLTKRMAVSFSLFHAKALADAFIGAANNPLAVFKQVAQAAAPKVFGENAYIKQLREGGAGDLVDKAQRGGLKFSFERESPAVEDVRGTFYTAMKDLETGLDNMIPGAGLPVKGFTKLNHAVDKFMWNRLHAGMKLGIFAEKYKTLLENNAAAHAKNPMVPLRKIEDIEAMAADFTNSIFGGLNWRRVAESTATKWGREAALSAYSPTGRRVSQILLFAPDWTISTTRAAIQAFGQGTGLKGLLRPENLADLHRQYLVRSAIYYVAVGDALNYSMSGHHLWDNKDPTTIDMGDGRRMQWSKHTMEPVHWLTKPGQQSLNKLGFVPREVANQALGTEYLSTSGHAPRMQNRAAHMARQFLPISVQQSFDAGEGSGVAGFLGVPIYGKTEQERLKIKEQKRLKRALGEK